MSRDEYLAMPKTLTLRLVEVHVAEKGFRTRHLHVVTTLLDAKRDTNESLAEPPKAVLFDATASLPQPVRVAYWYA